ncbi:BTB/POZ domain-containing protein KCTD4-like [Mercenaria mercenaria]|uniref:BTB/POZ domain-containing protein KCTD4-like n=1 Tax=Mercenaria mercenaria TaxID=6596 RepID=UPI00234F16D9|nr:BTB/POZ domain-containing protein KCTD4-like [Mercenaria mercenaria]
MNSETSKEEVVQKKLNESGEGEIENKKVIEKEGESNDVEIEENESMDFDIIPLLEETQQERIILNVGGQKFETSRVTLSKDPNCLLAKIVGKNGMTPRYGNQYFIDRDPAHFRLVLNFIRNGSCDLRTLPHDLRYLYELYYEAYYYNLPELVEAVIGKIEQCSVFSASVVPLSKQRR